VNGSHDLIQVALALAADLLHRDGIADDVILPAECVA